MYSMYVWIPIAVPEMGIRMARFPAPEDMKPGAKDFVTADYIGNTAGTKSKVRRSAGSKE